MKKENQKKFCMGLVMVGLFVVWTVLIQLVDVRAIGPLGSNVGFATLNKAIHSITGVDLTLYIITDWLGLVPIGFMTGFFVVGLVQWIKRKKLFKVDYSILALGVFYVATIAVYIFFEMFVVNYRPVLIESVLEASYPSSTTMLVMCVIPTAIMQFNERIRNCKLKRCVAFILSAFTVFMVIGRAFSGVHWFSDIVGGMLISSGLVLMYYVAQSPKK